MNKKLLVILSIIFIFLFVGCDEPVLRDKQTVIDIVEEYFPNVEYVSMKSTVDKNDMDMNLYTFRVNDEFTFEVYDNIIRDGPFFKKYNNIGSNYLDRLIEYRKEQIELLEEKYAIGCEISSGLHIIDVKIYVDDYLQIENSSYLINDIYLLFKDYLLLKENDLFEYDIIFSLNKKNTDTEFLVFRVPLNLSNSFFDMDSIYVMKKSYISHCRNGEIIDNTVPVDDYNLYPPEFFRELYINGSKFDGDANQRRFVYDKNTNQYYAFINFKDEPDTEYLLKKITETYYLNSNYNINDTFTIHSYYINDDFYEIKRDDFDRLYFYKNYQDLNISSYKKMAGYNYSNLDTKCYRWISINDFATILGMEVSHIDNYEGALYLIKK